MFICTICTNDLQKCGTHYRCCCCTPTLADSSFALYISSSKQPFVTSRNAVGPNCSASSHPVFPGLSRAAVRFGWNVWLPQPASAVPRWAAAALCPLAIVPFQSAAPHEPVLLRIAQPCAVPTRGRPAQPSAVL